MYSFNDFLPTQKKYESTLLKHTQVTMSARGVSGSKKSNETDDPNQSKPEKNRILWFG
jgi:hypothetical protein